MARKPGQQGVFGDEAEIPANKMPSMSQNTIPFLPFLNLAIPELFWMGAAEGNVLEAVEVVEGGATEDLKKRK